MEKELTTNTLIANALIFATKAHEKQTRKDSDTPYILHPMEAALIAANITGSEGKLNQELVAAQLLHDTIEDAEVSYETLLELFGKTVADYVQLQSEDKSKTWQERKDHTMEQLQENESRELEIAILSDKLSNMRSIFKDYTLIGEKLWSRFNAGKEKQKWYYSTIAANMKQLNGVPEFEEYKKLIEKTFN